MKLLLDTHVFLWYINGDSRLPAAFKTATSDPANEVFLSVAAIWEATIKQGLGKLPLPKPAAEYLAAQRQAHQIVSLPIEERAIARLESLPSLHRDPFDRIMIAQALEYDLHLATVDEAVSAYSVSLLPKT